MQNVPPPMSSHQLSLNPDPSALPATSNSQIPIYASFSDEGDGLAILWEFGYIEYWDLRMRLSQGPGEVMDPVKLWSGGIGEQTCSWRQLLVRSHGETLMFVLLGTYQKVDVISTIKVDGHHIITKQQRELPATGCRLICIYPVVAVQDQNGRIFERESRF